MSEVKVNKISPRTNCGTTTLGDSGDSFVIPSGVTITNNGTQTGFGRTGTVNWQTGSIKTATFTATSGEGYFCNTTSDSFTVNLPAGSAGAIVSVQDYNNTFDSNPLSISPNGTEKINGGAGGLSLSTEGQGLTLVYIDATVGWRSVQDNDFANPGSNFIIGSGGTESTCGDFKIHTFTGPGTFTVTAAAASPSNNHLEYLVVGGGGGAGGQSGNTRGGAGAGGFRFSAPSLAPLTYPAKPLAATALQASVQAYPITIGGGGAGSSSGAAGVETVFGSITSAGGAASGGNGGSGGGHPGGSINTPGGTGNTPPVSPAQGTDGGASAQQQPDHGSGGGGGGLVSGSDGRGPSCTGRSGPGGAGGGLPAGFGANGQPCGSFRYYAGGGGGGGHPPVSLNAGVGGLGGGASGSSSTGSSATVNTGGGGGGGGPSSNGGSGGSGIVVIRYKYQ